MLNTLTKFEKLMQEHEVIQANIKQIANSADNLLALANLHNQPADITDYQMNFLSDKRFNLKRSIVALKEGLVNHNQREEEMLSNLVGDQLSHVIRTDHRNVISKMAEMDWMLLNMSPVGLLFNAAFLKAKLDDLVRIITDGCVRENSILELLIRIPEN